jgi:uncharacterized protein
LTFKTLPVLPFAPEKPAAAPPVAEARRLRTSSYTIYVDLPDSAEEMVVVHGYSGAVDLVSRRVATYLRSLESVRPIRPLYGQWTPEPEIAPGTVAEPEAGTLAILKKRGYLTELTVDEEEYRLAGIARRLHQAASRQPNYIFMPTYDCNLRCFYCFQDHMRTKPEFRHLLRTMSFEMVDRIFQGMFGIEALHGLEPGEVERRNIGFFGGEPLLRQNRPVIERVIEKGMEAGEATFWAVTNATDLDAYADLLGPDRIGRVQITLDGPPAEHDRRRIYTDGSSSFQRIARNITMALEHGAAVDIRLNVDRDNILSLPELARVMIAHGWDQHPRWSCYTAPIHASNEKTERKRTFTSWGLDKALEELRLEFPELRVIDRPDDGLKNQARAIFASGSVPMHKGQFCGAHSSMYIFDAFGDLYACWERTGDQKIRIGNLEPDGGVNLSPLVLNAWRSRSVAENPICRKCRYALHCGGGCAVLAEGRRGTLTANFCDGYAARFRAMVAEAYVDHRSGMVGPIREGRVCDL